MDVQWHLRVHGLHVQNRFRRSLIKSYAAAQNAILALSEIKIQIAQQRTLVAEYIAEKYYNYEIRFNHHTQPQMTYFDNT